jgi:tRNA(adenine34) deaminase
MGVNSISVSSIVGLSAPPDLEQAGVDCFWMEHALALAQEAEANDEVPVGAVIVHDGICIAAARNAPIMLNDPTAHAEIIALRAAGQCVSNYRLTGATLYVTLEPCLMCSGAMVHARIRRVVYGAPDPRTGAAGSIFNVLQSTALNHQCELVSGVLAESSADLLRSFFRRRRIKPSSLDSSGVVCHDSTVDNVGISGLDP